MKIQLIRHATHIVHIKGLLFLVDPMFSRTGTMDPSPNTVPQLKNPLVDIPSNVDSRIFETVDAVIITHTHRDHWDDAAINLLPNEIPIFCQPEDSPKILDSGFTNVTSVETAVTWNGVTLTRTAARHGTGEMATKMGPVSGFILAAAKEPTLYVTGDTVWYQEVREVIARHRPNVVMAFSGAAEFTSGGPITMTAHDICSLCECAPETRVIAIHLEAWNHCSLRRADLRDYVDQFGVGQQVLIPEDGETMEFALREASPSGMCH